MKRSLFCLAVFFFSLSAFAQTNSLLTNSRQVQNEYPGRGLVAVANDPGKVTISWRYLPSDSPAAAFDLYRKINKGKIQKVNNEPLLNATCFTDVVGPSANITYYLRLAGKRENIASYNLSTQLAQHPYLSIPMKAVAGDTAWRYAPNDASLGDIDGDGEYELIIKRENRGFDNSHRGLCHGGALLEAYRLNGQFLWRVDLGENIRQGAHYTPFMVYDFDGDGKAEIAVRTAEGTTFADGTSIADVNNDGITDYVDRNPDSPTFGMITRGPEFLSVIEGATGKELARVDFISRGQPGEFGDSSANRSDRFLGGAGYFDGRRP
ncbi:MAG TPA: rhamnogalacturonan lyase, partial [Bacteroidales bacterium]|nr:rhamnogalacturonan lyase [Bacteroidales bacterium]